MEELHIEPDCVCVCVCVSVHVCVYVRMYMIMCVLSTQVGQFIDWVLRNRLELIQDGIASYPRLRTGQYLVNCRVNEVRL